MKKIFVLAVMGLLICGSFTVVGIDDQSESINKIGVEEKPEQEIKNGIIENEESQQSESTQFLPIGKITVNVKSSRGPPIKDADVTVRRGLLLSWSETTNAKGKAKFTNLPVGVFFATGYLVSARHPKYFNSMQQMYNVELSASSPSEEVTITLIPLNPFNATPASEQETTTSTNPKNEDDDSGSSSSTLLPILERIKNRFPIFGSIVNKLTKITGNNIGSEEQESSSNQAPDEESTPTESKPDETNPNTEPAVPRVAPGLVSFKFASGGESSIFSDTWKHVEKNENVTYRSRLCFDERPATGIKFPMWAKKINLTLKERKDEGDWEVICEENITRDQANKEGMFNYYTHKFTKNYSEDGHYEVTAIVKAYSGRIDGIVWKSGGSHPLYGVVLHTYVGDEEPDNSASETIQAIEENTNEDTNQDNQEDSSEETDQNQNEEETNPIDPVTIESITPTSATVEEGETVEFTVETTGGSGNHYYLFYGGDGGSTEGYMDSTATISYTYSKTGTFEPDVEVHDLNENNYDSSYNFGLITVAENNNQDNPI
ncbi:MAG: hypothetical protein V5A64_02560 [Candidatus Thermoplasmatota archaeon]